MIEGCRYLDLFGGTGGVGIEALSRGAARAIFCERDRWRCASWAATWTRPGLSGAAPVAPGDAFAYLARPDAGSPST